MLNHSIYGCTYSSKCRHDRNRSRLFMNVRVILNIAMIEIKERSHDFEMHNRKS